jgi:hypothetical protein
MALAADEEEDDDEDDVELAFFSLDSLLAGTWVLGATMGRVSMMASLEAEELEGF